MLEGLDTNIGRLMDALGQESLLEDTVVIFTSDNGGLSTAEGSPTCNLPLAEGKGWIFEGGTRVPLLISFPGRISSGGSSQVPVTSPDLFPTLADLAGVRLADDLHLDGASLVPVLEGSDDMEQRSLFWHYPHYGNQGGTPGSSIRKGRFKLVEFFEDHHIELFDLEEDPGELKNLAGEKPGIAESLLSELHEWHTRVEAKYPKPNMAGQRLEEI